MYLEQIQLEFVTALLQHELLLINFYFSALDERNTTLEELDFGNFGYGWMDGRVASYNLPPDLEELVNEVKEAAKFKLEFQDFRSSRRLTQEQT